MRFTTAWAGVASQNIVLKIVICALTAVIIGLGSVCAKLSLKEPLIIERSCFSSPVESKPLTQTAVEVESFVKAAVRTRFDSDANPNAEFLSSAEMKFRLKEQDEMNRRQIRQRVIVNKIVRSGQVITANCDRIIAVGDVRSAFLFPLTLEIASVPRTEINPYGLLITKITQPTGENNNEKK